MLYPQQNSMRSLFHLDGIWDLSRELDEIDYSSGFPAEKKVAVPGSFNDLYVEEEFRTWMKGMWYSRRFSVPKSLREERIILRFGSVNYRAAVYLNGIRLGEHETGYTPFEFDITNVVRFEEDNLLCVRVENILSAETVPMGNLRNEAGPGQICQHPDAPFDFFPYAGIHRPVVIYTTGKTAWLEKTVVTTDVDGTDGRISLKGVAAGSAQKIELYVKETDEISVTEVSGSGFAAALKIRHVKLWDIYKPNLYNIRIRLLSDSGEILDEYTQRIGVRSVKIDGCKLLLNGRPVYLQGFGRHEDFPIIGKGLNHSVNIRDHELLKWIHANSYRTTHYPYSEELVQLADEQGLLLIAEAPAVSINFNYATGRTLEVHKQARTELIERDRNNPSVIMWSVANEATTEQEAAVPYFAALADLVRALDPTRPVTLVSHKGTADRVLQYFDVVGINLYPGWYELPGQIEAAKKGMCTMLTGLYEKFGKPVFVFEFGADTIAGMHALPAEQWSEEYQTELILALIDSIREHDFVIGEHIWNFADFRTSQNFFRTGGNRKGVFTRERQPKMVAHFLKKKWATSRYDLNG